MIKTDLDTFLKFLDKTGRQKHYWTVEEELNKIPEICSQKPCYFDLLKNSEEGRDTEFVKKLAEKRCPKMCPKYCA